MSEIYTEEFKEYALKKLEVLRKKKYTMIKQEKISNIRRLCEVLEISSYSLYEWDKIKKGIKQEKKKRKSSFKTIPKTIEDIIYKNKPKPEKKSKPKELEITEPYSMESEDLEEKSFFNSDIKIKIPEENYKEIPEISESIILNEPQEIQVKEKKKDTFAEKKEKMKELIEQKKFEKSEDRQWLDRQIEKVENKITPGKTQIKTQVKKRSKKEVIEEFQKSEIDISELKMLIKACHQRAITQNEFFQYLQKKFNLKEED